MNDAPVRDIWFRYFHKKCQCVPILLHKYSRKSIAIQKFPAMRFAVQVNEVGVEDGTAIVTFWLSEGIAYFILGNVILMFLQLNFINTLCLNDQ